MRWMAGNRLGDWALGRPRAFGVFDPERSAQDKDSHVSKDCRTVFEAQTPLEDGKVLLKKQVLFVREAFARLWLH